MLDKCFDLSTLIDDYVGIREQSCLSLSTDTVFSIRNFLNELSDFENCGVQTYTTLNIAVGDMIAKFFLIIVNIIRYILNYPVC